MNNSQWTIGKNVVILVFLTALTATCSTSHLKDTRTQENLPMKTRRPDTQAFATRTPKSLQSETPSLSRILQPTSTPGNVLESPTPLPEIIPSPEKYFLTRIKWIDSFISGLPVTAFWSNPDKLIYALDDGYTSPLPKNPHWFSLNLQTLQDRQLTSPPKINYPPLFDSAVIYPQFTGFVSPSGAYSLELVSAESEFAPTPDPAISGLWLVSRTGSGSRTRIIDRIDLSYFYAFWFPDESKIIFGVIPGFGLSLYMLDVPTKTVTPLSDLIGFEDEDPVGWSLSPDRTRIIIVGGDGILHVFSLEGKPAIELKGFHQNVRWSGDSQGLFYYVGSNLYEIESIDWYDLRSGRTQRLINYANLVEQDVPFNFDVSPNGDRLVFWGEEGLWLAFLPGNKIYTLSDGTKYSITKAGEGLNLRDEPSVKGEILTRLHSTNTVRILGGPVQTDGYFWWKMKDEKGIEGWAVYYPGWYEKVK